MQFKKPELLFSKPISFSSEIFLLLLIQEWDLFLFFPHLCMYYGNPKV